MAIALSLFASSCTLKLMVYRISTLLILILLSSYFAERWVSAQFNTLARNGEWYSSKHLNSPYSVGLVGHNDFVFGRQALARDRLNLGTWFGFNEITYVNEIKNFLEYEVQFSLGTPESQLFIDLNCDLKKCVSVRLSPDPLKPSGIYEIQHDGEFLKKQIISFVPSVGDHHFRAQKVGTEYLLFYDHLQIANIELNDPTFPIRFRNGANDVSIEKINVTLSDHNQLDIQFKKSFSITYFFISLLLQLAFIGFLWIVFRKNPEREIKLVTLQLFLLILVSAIYFTDRHLWSSRYYTDQFNPTLNPSSKFSAILEEIRRSFADFISPQEEYLAKYRHAGSRLGWLPGRDFTNWELPKIWPERFQIIRPPQKPAFASEIEKDHYQRSFKLGFLGGSQTWGAGASAGTKTFPFLVSEGIQKLLKQQVFAVNFAMCGAKLEHFEKVFDSLINYKPDLLIVNFGGNDNRTETLFFTKNFQRFVNLMKENSIPVLISIEAVSSEFKSKPHSNYELLKKLVYEYQIPMVDLQTHLEKLSQSASGLLWIDGSHLSDFGHRKTAEFLLSSDVLISHLKRRR